jgi:prevent-host-death family protein
MSNLSNVSKISVLEPEAPSGPSISLNEARTSTRRFVDLIASGVPRSAHPPPVLVHRYSDPYVLGITWQSYLNHARGADLVPVEFQGRRSIDWETVPADAKALVIDARLLQNNLAKITERVNRRGTHIIIRRHGEPLVALVPTTFLDPPSEPS